MAVNTVPTKGNLIATKKSLELARVGYDLLDRKRNILVREMMTLMDKAATIQGEIDSNTPRRTSPCSGRISCSASANRWPKPCRWITD